MSRVVLLVDVALHTFGEVTAGEQNASTAALAFQADVCAHPHNRPISSATGVRLAQTHDIFELNLGKQCYLSARRSAAHYTIGSVAPARWYNLGAMLDLSLSTIISRLIILSIAFTVHEFAHAWTADQLGDDTPRNAGRLTLNPLSHLDPLGSLLLVVAGFGWAKPVPINPYALERRTPAGTMIVSAAGPFSNLVLAVIAAIPFQIGAMTPGRGGGLLPTPSGFLLEFIFINLILVFFNLIPVSPLDGEKVLAYFLPPSGRETLAQIRPYGPMILMLLVFIGPWIGLDLLTWFVGWPSQQLLRFLVL